jgi:hypothetical protein
VSNENINLAQWDDPAQEQRVHNAVTELSKLGPADIAKMLDLMMARIFNPLAMSIVVMTDKMLRQAMDDHNLIGALVFQTMDHEGKPAFGVGNADTSLPWAEPHLRSLAKAIRDENVHAAQRVDLGQRFKVED